MRKKEKREKCGHFEKCIALFLKRPFEQAFHFFGSALQIAEEKITPSKVTSNCDNNKKLKQVVFMRMIWKTIHWKRA
jgi:hypothetical protein